MLFSSHTVAGHTLLGMVTASVPIMLHDKWSYLWLVQCALSSLSPSHIISTGHLWLTKQMERSQQNSAETCAPNCPAKHAAPNEVCSPCKVNTKKNFTKYNSSLLCNSVSLTIRILLVKKKVKYTITKPKNHWRSCLQIGPT